MELQSRLKVIFLNELKIIAEVLGESINSNDNLKLGLTTVCWEMTTNTSQRKALE